MCLIALDGISSGIRGLHLRHEGQTDLKSTSPLGFSMRQEMDATSCYPAKAASASQRFAA